VSDASKKARRDQAREHAREQREKERRRKQRNGWIIKIVVVVLAVASAVGGVFIYTGVKNAADEAAKPKPGPANMISDGIILTASTTTQGEITAVPTPAIKAGGKPVATDKADYPDQVRIVTYIDYFCPYCQAFEQTNTEQIGTWVSGGAATLEVHPIAILDKSSMGTRYASRAANAMACVANYEPESYFQASTAMYAKQPAEGTTGLTNNEILTILYEANVKSEKIPDCVEKEQFGKWVTDSTKRALTGPLTPDSEVPNVSGTPTVLVNGFIYRGALDDASAFEQFVNAVATGTYTPPAQ
jgi:protein-disulfide isomerase